LLLLLDGVFNGGYLVRPSVVAEPSRYCHADGPLRMDKVSVTSFAASIEEAGSADLCDEVSNLRRHEWHRTARAEGVRMPKD